MKIWAKPLPKNAKSPLLVGIPQSKMSLLPPLLLIRKLNMIVLLLVFDS